MGRAGKGGRRGWEKAKRLYGSVLSRDGGSIAAASAGTTGPRPPAPTYHLQCRGWYARIVTRKSGTFPAGSVSGTGPSLLHSLRSSPALAGLDRPHQPPTEAWVGASRRMPPQPPQKRANLTHGEEPRSDDKEGGRGGEGETHAAAVEVATAAATAAMGEEEGEKTTSSRSPSSLEAVTLSSLSDESSSSSSSLCATANNGYATFDGALRSVLFHPLGLPILYCFHDDDHDLGKYLRTSTGLFPDVTDVLRLGSDSDGKRRHDGDADGHRFDGVLQASCDEALGTPAIKHGKRKKTNDGSEQQEELTRILCENISKELSGSDSWSDTGDPLRAVRAHHPQSKARGTTALLVHRDNKGEEVSGGIVLLLEVGIRESNEQIEDDHEAAAAGFWWEMADRCAQRLGHLLDPNNNHGELKADCLGPTLLAVLTLTTEATGQEESAAAAAVVAEFCSARLGVFLCAPQTLRQGPPTFRMALLRRDNFETLEDASRGLGKALRAATALDALVLGDAPEFRALGPACCRVGNKVLRVYDSRFRRTYRRPDLYGDASIAPGARVVCRIADKEAERGGPRHEFKLWDDRGPVTGASDKQLLWLWQRKGELLLIETDFHHGRHYATSPKDFIPIVRFLQNLHKRGYVHGVIRCANIVFPLCLIDFDMGGRVDDSPKYPPGYVRHLVDGSRRGMGGELMSKSDDWYALRRIILVMHHLCPPKPLDLGDTSRKLLSRFHSLAALALDDSTILNLSSELELFLEAVDAKSWTFSYEDSFERDFVHARGDDSQEDPRQSSDSATGGPVT